MCSRTFCAPWPFWQLGTARRGPLLPSPSTTSPTPATPRPVTVRAPPTAAPARCAPLSRRRTRSGRGWSRCRRRGSPRPGGPVGTTARSSATCSGWAARARLGATCPGGTGRHGARSRPGSTAGPGAGSGAASWPSCGARRTGGAVLGHRGCAGSRSPAPARHRCRHPPARRDRTPRQGRAQAAPSSLLGQARSRDLRARGARPPGIENRLRWALDTVSRDDLAERARLRGRGGGQAHGPEPAAPGRAVHRPQEPPQARRLGLARVDRLILGAAQVRSPDCPAGLTPCD
jgi:hypothetical protein